MNEKQLNNLKKKKKQVTKVDYFQFWRFPQPRDRMPRAEALTKKANGRFFFFVFF